MNLRKKKTQFSYQDSEFLSKNYQYEELTKGKHRQQATESSRNKPEGNPKTSPTVPEAGEKDYTLIFAQLMDSIRRNMEQKKSEPEKLQLDESENGDSVEESRRKEAGKKIKIQTKKSVNAMKLKKVGGESPRRFKKVNDQEGVQIGQRESQVEGQSEPSGGGDKVADDLMEGIKASSHPPKAVKRCNGSVSQTKAPTHPEPPTEKNQNQQISQSVSNLSKIQSSLMASETRPHPHYPNQYSGFSLSSNSLPAYNRLMESSVRPNYDSHPKTDGKLFNRSSYHIAIAYHIHFKKNQFYSDPLEVDPTHHAKKMMQKVRFSKL